MTDGISWLQQDDSEYHEIIKNRSSCLTMTSQLNGFVNKQIKIQMENHNVLSLNSMSGRFAARERLKEPRLSHETTESGNLFQMEMTRNEKKRARMSVLTDGTTTLKR